MTESAHGLGLSGRQTEGRTPEGRAPEVTGPQDRRPPGESHVSVHSVPEMGQDSGTLGIVKRLLVFLILVVAVYLVLLRISHFAFAPRLEVLHPLTPPAMVVAGEPVSLGAVIRNDGRMEGAAFVTAVFRNGVEVEGPTVPVPAGDSTVVTVAVALGAGEHQVSLVAFDGWRGVRRLRVFQGLRVTVESRVMASSDIRIPDRVSRGETMAVAFAWSNAGEIRQTVIPTVVFRPRDGGVPVAIEGPALEVEPLESRILDFEIDSWQLRPGHYLAEVQIHSPDGGLRGETIDLLPVEVIGSDQQRPATGGASAPGTM